MKKIKLFIALVLIVSVCILVYQFSIKYLHENKILKQVIGRLQADSRIAEVLVTNVSYNEKTRKTETTIKFLEYDVKGNPLKPKYFTFSGNIIQFQSLVIRFEDIYIRNANRLRGKSAFLFWKVFTLDGKNTQEYEITKAGRVPAGYIINGTVDPFEEKLWKNFWAYALDPNEAKKIGIKNAQVEAPGTMFIPGTLYTIRIEHDGGMRIDAVSLPSILRGEKIPEVQKIY